MAAWTGHPSLSWNETHLWCKPCVHLDCKKEQKKRNANLRKANENERSLKMLPLIKTMFVKCSTNNILKMLIHFIAFKMFWSFNSSLGSPLFSQIFLNIISTGFYRVIV